MVTSLSMKSALAFVMSSARTVDEIMPAKDASSIRRFSNGIILILFLINPATESPLFYFFVPITIVCLKSY